MKVSVKYIVFATLVSLAGCVDPISFETDSEGGQLVFYGNFSQLNDNHIFNISQTIGFGQYPIPVPGVCIEILDDAGNSALYEEVETGQYLLTPEKMTGIPGRSYHIEIMLPDGQIYRSDPQVMPEPVELDDVYFEIGPKEVLSSSGDLIDQTFIDVYIDTSLPKSTEGNTHLRWTVEEVYSFVDRSCHPLDPSEQCYFIDPVDESEVLLFENESSSQEFLTRFKVRTRRLVPYDEFTARHYFNVRQHTISEQELDYWKKIDAVANQSGSLFDVQPAKVVGNIYQTGNPEGLVLGYFGVNGQSILRTFTTPFGIKPYPVFTCNDQSFFQEHQPECCYCSTKEGVRITRPDYWDD